MQLSIVAKTIGLLLMVFSFAQVPPLIVDLIYSEGEYLSFVYSFALTVLGGLILWWPFKEVKKDFRLREGDHVYFLAKKNDISRALKEFRRAENSYQKIFIAGGGSVGLNVAKLLEESHNLRIIELDENRAKYLSEELNNTLVLQGNASDEDLLKEEGIENTDLFLALTDSDEVNVIVSILSLIHI